MTAVAPDWYAGGLRFSCTQCGNCCTGPPGTVWFTDEEGRRIARTLGVETTEFYKRYARKVDGRWSLRERPAVGSSYDCGRLVFLCWKLGESEVLNWHEVDAGFRGRQPLVAGTMADQGPDHEDDGATNSS